MYIGKSMLALIISSIFAQSNFHFDRNITLSYDSKAEKVAVKRLDLIDRFSSNFMDSQRKYLIELNKNEDLRKTKLESVNNHNNKSYNRPSFRLAVITFPSPEEEKRSDLFYYILGIITLIIAMFILRQRYKEYLKERDKLNR